MLSSFFICASLTGFPWGSGVVGFVATEPCHSLASKVRGLTGDQQRAQFEELTASCFVGPWEGQLRHFFPGATYPYDHFCCPKAKLEFTTTDAGIKVTLEEEGASALDFTCVPGDEQYECKGASTRHARCKLEATPTEAATYSKIALECGDDKDQLTLRVSVERKDTDPIPDSKPLIASRLLRLLRDIAQGRPSAEDYQCKPPEEYAELIRRSGAVSRAELVKQYQQGFDIVYEYDLECANEKLHVTLALDPGERVTQLAIRLK